MTMTCVTGCADGLRGVYEDFCRRRGACLGQQRSPVLVHGSTMVLDCYDFGSVLGEGSFGRVSNARCLQSGHTCVVKAIQREGSDIERVQAEVEIQSELDHPNICRVFETFEDAGCLYIVMERCLGGELLERSGWSEAGARDVFEQTCRAVRYMHGRGIAHRDVKLENFLIKGEGEEAGCVVKLIDFGFATRFEPGAARMATICGTPGYMAPEVLLKQTYDEKCDIFSLGVILFALLTDRFPFDGESVEESSRRTLHGAVVFSDEEQRRLSREARFLVHQACMKCPKRRPAAREVLQMPWLQQAGTADESCQQLLRNFVEHAQEQPERTPFVRIAMRLAAHYLEDANLGPLPQLFKLIDADGNGKITKEEVQRVKLDGAPSTSTKWQNLLGCALADLSGDGEIDYNEFVVACMDASVCLTREACHAAFRALEDGGIISSTKLCKVLSSCYGSRWMQQHRREVEAMCEEVRGSTLDLEAFISVLGLPRSATVCGAAALAEAPNLLTSRELHGSAYKR